LPKPLIIAALSVCGLLGSNIALQSASAATTSAPGVVAKYDKDSDQTLDLAEVKAAASVWPSSRNYSIRSTSTSRFRS
jgi:hypothetical protein